MIHPMKRFLRYAILLCLFLVPGIFAGCEDTDWWLAADAGLDAVKAVTLSDEEVTQLAVRASRQSDAKHRIAPDQSPYARRLYSLVPRQYRFDNLTYNIKVYLSPTVNAFAMADGTIRIYTGLMDMLDDEELMFVVGHEMGHVAQKHIKKKIMVAYAGRAVRKGIASQENAAGDIARSVLGGILESLLNAQFSQQEEREADDFGLLFIHDQSINPSKAVSALKKLATLGNSHSFLSSHPAPAARAKRLYAQIQRPAADQISRLDEKDSSGWLDRLMTWIKGLMFG